MRVLALTLLLTIVVTLPACIIRHSQDGKTVNEVAFLPGKCGEPRKTYTNHVKAELDSSVGKIKDTEQAKLKLTIENEVIRLTQFTPDGMDRDLVHWRICDTLLTLGISEEKSVELLTLVYTTWDNNVLAAKKKQP